MINPIGYSSRLPHGQLNRPCGISIIDKLMINLFNKLKREELLKANGILADLGSGNGKLSEPFFRYGYQVELIDKNAEVLMHAESVFKSVKDKGYKIIKSSIEDFKFEKNYDGIMFSNVLPFIKDKEKVSNIIKESYKRVNGGGFLFFTLFGIKDQWAIDKADIMSFYDKNEALSILEKEPYYVSEDYGRGSTMKGDMKIWHIFHILYIK